MKRKELVKRKGLPKYGPPTHPGETLSEEFLKPLGLSMAAAARAIGVSQQLVHRIVAGDTPVTVRTALRLERWLGVNASTWLHLQRNWDMWQELRANGKAIGRIPRIWPPRGRRRLDE